MDDRECSCCFTGHRPMKLPWGMNEDDPRCVSLKQELDARLEEDLPEGIRMIRVHPFSYAAFDESALLQADLYIVHQGLPRSLPYLSSVHRPFAKNIISIII